VTVFFHLCVILILVAVNAFFIAAEYSLLSIRRTRLEQLVSEGNPRARLVQKLLADVGVLFSGTQLGVTIASVLMGWLGEHTLAAAIEPLLEDVFHEHASVVGHAISVTIAFVLITALLMVLGELAPKALAYERSERVALVMARPMLLFLEVTRYPVRAIIGLAKLVLRA